MQKEKFAICSGHDICRCLVLLFLLRLLFRKNQGRKIRPRFYIVYIMLEDFKRSIYIIYLDVTITGFFQCCNLFTIYSNRS
jgi:hypothetical protein